MFSGIAHLADNVDVLIFKFGSVIKQKNPLILFCKLTFRATGKRVNRISGYGLKYKSFPSLLVLVKALIRFISVRMMGYIMNV